MTYDDAVAYLGSLNLYGWRMGNARMRQFLRLLGDPQEETRVIHVTGTNGKGSTTAFTASVLIAAGYKVGSYFSPYVFDVRERVQFNGNMIPKEEFARWIMRCQPIIERLRDTEYGQVTEFELKTALAYAYFAEQGADFSVMEVGLGGRLDATNVIIPEVSVIASIGLDHTDRLGSTYQDIAYEKGAIMKTGRPAVCAVQPEGAREMLNRLSERRAVPITWVKLREGRSPVSGSVLSYSPLESPTDSSLLAEWEEGTLELHPQLIGSFQRSNATCALGVALRLRERGCVISDEAIKKGISEASLPGRLQIVQAEPRVVLDGAHNPDAVRALAQTLPKLFDYDNLYLVFGMFKPHDPREPLEMLLPLAAKVILTRTEHVRAYAPDELLVRAPNAMKGRIELQPDPLQAFETALRHAKHNDLILVTGSFYLIGKWSERQPS